MTVCSYDKAVFVFKDGSNVEWKIKNKKNRRMNGAFHYGLRTFYFCSMLNLCTIGILLCEMSFDDSAVTFLPPTEIYLAQQFSSGTFSGLYARHKSRESLRYNGVSGIK